MKVKVVGKEIRKGVSKKTGKEFHANVAHVMYRQSRVEGSVVNSLWIDPSMCKYEDIILDGEICCRF